MDSAGPCGPVRRVAEFNKGGMMIIEYYRPQTMEEALKLLARSSPVTIPLAGGSALNHPSPEPVAVVDLQALGLGNWEKSGHTLVLGATLTLQAMLDIPGLPAALIQSIHHEASYNLRQVATVAGTLFAADGRSPLTTTLLALDASLEWARLGAGADTSPLGDLLPLRKELQPGRLATRIHLPLNARLAYNYVARTPADRPLVCAAVAVWPSGRTRVALGGYGSAPLLALDGPEPGGVETAARSAFSQAGDEWASAEYRRDTAAILAGRGLEELRLENRE